MPDQQDIISGELVCIRIPLQNDCEIHNPSCKINNLISPVVQIIRRYILI